MSGWRVFASWTGIPDRVRGGVYVGPEICHEFESWPLARKDARQLSCLNGVRYVSVQRPDDVVVADYDGITNQWRQYPRELADVEHTTEVIDEGWAAGAWCTCGWSAFVPYNTRLAGAADLAAAKAREQARRHEADPAGLLQAAS